MGIDKEAVNKALKEVIDPEVGIDIMQMGLIKEVKIEEDGVRIKMTFTSPFCPLQHYIIEEVKEKVKGVGAAWVDVEVVWD
jgi:metal-sulfur cluster biosynthetic enzyme